MSDTNRNFIRARYAYAMAKQAALGGDGAAAAAHQAEYEAARQYVWSRHGYMYCFTQDEVFDAIAHKRPVVLGGMWTPDIEAYSGSEIAVHLEHGVLRLRVGNAMDLSIPARPGSSRQPLAGDPRFKFSWGLSKLRWHAWLTMVNFHEPESGMDALIALYDVPEPAPFMGAEK